VWSTSAYSIFSILCIHKLSFGPEESDTDLQMAFMLTVSLALSMLGFGGFHVKMVLCNETSIEQAGCRANSVYNVGWQQNAASVFGAGPSWRWFVPLYFDGPVGDGIIWPKNRPAAAYSPAHQYQSVSI
jgi:hypothetical protein